MPIKILLISLMPLTLKQYAKDDLELTSKPQRLKHDTFFNSRKKAIFESRLAKLVIEHMVLLLPAICKVSQHILTDFEHVITHRASCTPDSLEHKFLQQLRSSVDLQSLYSSCIDRDQFYSTVLKDLSNQHPDSFIKHLSLQRFYLNFFIEGGINLTNQFHQAVSLKWSKVIDLTTLYTDALALRRDLFTGYLRVNRKLTEQGTSSTNIGILAPEDYQSLNRSNQSRLQNQMPSHLKGGLSYRITTRGIFTSLGMHQYDLPQLCGPSGTLALRLALAKQARLSTEEMQKYDFAISMLNIAVGAHSLDESLIIGSGFSNQYQRGNLVSAIPPFVTSHPAFRCLWIGIKCLFLEFLNYRIPTCDEVKEATHISSVKI